jgi:hypothetical protein
MKREHGLAMEAGGTWNGRRSKCRGNFKRKNYAFQNGPDLAMTNCRIARDDPKKHVKEYPLCLQRLR